MTPTPEQLIEMLERATYSTYVVNGSTRIVGGSLVDLPLRDALISALRQMCWNFDMEVAPRDGTFIEIALTIYSGRIATSVARFVGEDEDDEDRWVDQFGDCVTSTPSTVFAWRYHFDPSPPPTEGEST